MPCLNCSKETENPKFCSRSCAALFNNARKDVKRRTVEGSCAACGIPIKKSRKYCAEHRTVVSVLDKSVNSNLGTNSYVRGNARLVYKKSGRPYVCALCQYSLHVDICHIKDIRSYPHGTAYSVINHESNLIGLCKNHHWEFDHDVL